MQSNLALFTPVTAIPRHVAMIPRHVAIIMDGNGRWAQSRGLPRIAGHRAGVAAVRRIVERASDAGVACLTLYAFSSDNWRRPATEVQGIFWLLRAFLRLETGRLCRRGARLEVIGRRDRLPLARASRNREGRARNRSGRGHSALRRHRLLLSRRHRPRRYWRSERNRLSNCLCRPPQPSPDPLSHTRIRRRRSAHPHRW